MSFIVIYLYVHCIKSQRGTELARFCSLGMSIMHFMINVLFCPAHPSCGNVSGYHLTETSLNSACEKDYNCWRFLLSADTQRQQEMWRKAPLVAKKQNKPLICTSCPDANATSPFQSGLRSSSYSSRSCMWKGKGGGGWWWRGEKMTLINPLWKQPTCLVQSDCDSVINTH